MGQPARHQGGRKELIGQPATGRQERTSWTAWEDQGGRKGLIGQPARHQGGRQEKTNWTAWEATKGSPIKRAGRKAPRRYERRVQMGSPIKRGGRRAPPVYHGHE